MSLISPSRKNGARREPGVVTVASRDGRQVFVRSQAMRDTLRRADKLAVKLSNQTRQPPREAR